MSELLKNIDARTKLAGTNKLEILLFFLGVDQRTGRRETYGINVFKVREVMRTPAITAAPDMPPSVEGMVSLRGALVPNRVMRTALAGDVLDVLHDFSLPVLDAALSQRSAYALSAVRGTSVFGLGRAAVAAQEEVGQLVAAVLKLIEE